MRDGHNKVYKSFSDVTEGKEGRFRETLFGKRVTITSYFGFLLVALTITSAPFIGLSKIRLI